MLKVTGEEDIICESKENNKIKRKKSSTNLMTLPFDHPACVFNQKFFFQIPKIKKTIICQNQNSGVVFCSIFFLPKMKFLLCEIFFFLKKK